MRQLDQVLQNKTALDALRAGMHLSVALEVGEGDEALFRRSLLRSKESLQKARATLSTGYDGSRDLIQLAEQISDLSVDLYSEMERKYTKSRRTRGTGRNAKGRRT